MGSCHSDMSFTCSAEVDAPVETMWEVIHDVENFHTFVSEVTKGTILSHGNPDTMVGFKWQEDRLLFGRPFSSFITLEKVEMHGDVQSRTYSYGFSKDILEVRDSYQISSVHIIPLPVDDEGGARSRIVYTFNFASGGVFGCLLKGRCCRWCIQSCFRRLLESELEEYTDEAESRYSLSRQIEKFKGDISTRQTSVSSTDSSRTEVPEFSSFGKKPT